MNEQDIQDSFAQATAAVQVGAFAPLLIDQEILLVCQQLGYRHRTSAFTPPARVRSMVARGLRRDKSIKAAVEDLAAEGLVQKPKGISESAWCQARSRLPEGLFPALIQATAARAEKRWGPSTRWRGWRVLVADGSTLSMPDTPELARAFGYSKGRRGESRFPLARIVALLDSRLRVIDEHRVAPYAVSEQALFREMLARRKESFLWIGDRYFWSPANFALSRRVGAEWVVRLHGGKDGKRLAQQGQPLGPDEWLVTLEVSSQMRAQHRELELPRQIPLRLIRHRYVERGQVKALWLATSLLDPVLYPRAEIIALYGKRWGIETHYNYLKTTLEMAVLRSKTEKNIRSEIGATILAHNLVWTLVHEAAENSGVAVKRVSFAATIKTVLAFSPRLSQARGEERLTLYKQMLERIIMRSHRVPHRPGRQEPRAVKRVLRKYPELTTPREKRRCVA